MKAAKKVKLTDSKDVSDVKFDDINKKQVDKISTVSPVDDLRAMLARRDDAKIATRAIVEMIEVIKNLVKESYGDANYAKAIDCLVALRAGCVQMEEFKLFNDAIVSLQNTFAKKKDAFWKLVSSHAGTGINPIDTTECAHSTYSPESARKFHASSNSQSVPSVSVSVSASNDCTYHPPLPHSYSLSP